MIVKRIKSLLAGREPEIQGAVLADCLAIWLAGHIVPGDPAATARLRAEILAMHLDAIPRLIAVNAKIMGLDQ
jgi:hypothetical protein